MKKMFFVLSVCAGMGVSVAADVTGPAEFAPGERVSFVGDSITHGGGFVAYLTLFHNLRHPGDGARVINSGISGGTLAQALRRFDNDIMRDRPDRVFVMMGMNDIRRPFWSQAVPDEKNAGIRAEAITAYGTNLTALVGRFFRAGVKTVLMTPTPYDQYAVISNRPVLAACNDPGLSSCAEIVRKTADEKGLAIVDLHRPLTELLKRGKSGAPYCHDRIHPGAVGNLIVAAEILKAMRIQAEFSRIDVDAKADGVERLPSGGVAFDYAPTALPFPNLPEYAEAEACYPLTETFNREIVAVRNLPAGSFVLSFDGREVGRFSADALARGVNVALLDTPNQLQARALAGPLEEFRALVQLRRREQLVKNMLHDNGIDSADGAAADDFMDKWLEARRSNPAYRSFKAWIDTYRLLQKNSADYADREERLRATLAGVRPKRSRVSVVPVAGPSGQFLGASAAVSESWDLATVRRQADRAADWQIIHPVTTGRFVEQHTPLYWTMGAFYNGLLDWGLANPESRRFVDHVRRIGEEVGWDRQRLSRLVIGHADTHCVCSAWLQLAAEDAVLPARIRATQECFDALRADRTEYPIEFDRKNPLARMRWTWADALYMSPPSWVLLAGLTGDRGYLDHMTKEFKATTAKLFSEKVRLYYRDSTYLPGGQNWKGRDVFWGRGNGWVFGAFAMILRDMPADYPERAWFVSRFRAMAEGVAACQQADGSWHPDLADAKSPDCPEMSGTSFFTYGFLWGMNNGLLDSVVYEPVVRRSWSAICRAMDESGRLGWVQQVGSSPTAELKPDYSEFYATGAYLCAAKELYTWLVRKMHPKSVSVVVTGGKAYEPNREVRLRKGTFAPGERVWDVRYGREVTGIIDASGDFVFKVNVLAGQHREFLVLRGVEFDVCNAMVCPERQNDFVWENDLFGMRAYGPGEYHKFSGLDVFNKNTSSNVCIAWTRDVAVNHPRCKPNFHENRGQGMDNYTMGSSRGCGGVAVWGDGEWKTYPNWETCRILHTGPDFCEFELVYPSFSAAGKMTYHITLRRGERFFRNDVSFERMPKGFAAGPGLDVDPSRDHRGSLVEDERMVSLFEDVKEVDGSTMTAVFVAPDAQVEKMTDRQNSRVLAFRGKKSFTYWAGAAWSSACDLKSPAAWHDCVRRSCMAVRGGRGTP